MCVCVCVCVCGLYNLDLCLLLPCPCDVTVRRWHANEVPAGPDEAEAVWIGRGGLCGETHICSRRTFRHAHLFSPLLVLMINPAFFFTIDHLFNKTLKKQQKKTRKRSVKNAQHNMPEPKVTSSNCLFHPTDSRAPNDPVSRILCYQLTLMQNTVTSNDDMCAKWGITRSYFLLISPLSQQEVERQLVAFASQRGCQMDER